MCVAATAFATQASANPFAWLGLGYVPTDDGNRARTDLQPGWSITRATKRRARSSSIPPTAHLYYVLPGGKAIRYGVGVGREGFTWFGVRPSRTKRSGRIGC